MLIVLAIAALMGDIVAAGISDPNCTIAVNGELKYSDKATNCGNKYSDVYCTAVFGQQVDAANGQDRPDNCFKADGAINQEVKMLAISACPKTCGYCCVTPAYNCPNKPFPRIQCEVITPPMCANHIWKPIIAEDCPNICGFCEESNCKDDVPYCAQLSTICRNAELTLFAKQHCKRTCGYCTSATGNSSDCGSNPNCPNWIRNNFCTNTFYTLEQKKKYCGRPCNLC